MIDEKVSGMILVSAYDDIQGLERLAIIGWTCVGVGIAVLLSASTILKAVRNPVKSQRYFSFGVASFILCLGMSRAVLLYHDYFAPDDQSVLVWKIGTCFWLLGLLCFTLVFEMFAFRKTRFILTVFSLVTLVFFMLTPKEIASYANYLGGVVSIVLPWVIYLYLAIISKGDVRVQAIWTAFALFLVFGTQYLIVLLSYINIIGQFWSQILAWGSAVAGGIVLTASFSRFTRLNASMLEYYQSKRVCIVHRGTIEGKIFICSTCNVFYCIPCRDAIVELENKCWNCKAPLSKSGPAAEEHETAGSGDTPSQDISTDDGSVAKKDSIKDEGK
jgi:hypothetical protein